MSNKFSPKRAGRTPLKKSCLFDKEAEQGEYIVLKCVQNALYTNEFVILSMNHLLYEYSAAKMELKEN